MFNAFLWEWFFLSGLVEGFQNPGQTFFGNNEFGWRGNFLLYFPEANSEH